MSTYILLKMKKNIKHIYIKEEYKNLYAEWEDIIKCNGLTVSSAIMLLILKQLKELKGE